MPKQKDFDIANIAESILKSESKQGKLVSTPQGIIRPNAPDISKVTVPHSYTNTILEHSFGEKTTKKVSPVVRESNQTVNPEVYVKKLMHLIQEAKNLIDEMTTCGSIGTNMGGTPKVKAKKKKITRKGY
jgi:hypothetical protein